MTEPEIADFQANLLTALYELEKATDVRSRLIGSPGEAYLQAADDDMIEVAAALVKTWGRIDRPRHLQNEANS
jgi:recombinational DNA repair ATPase RecF